MNSLPIIKNPAAEHARLDKMIRARLERLGRTEEQFNHFVQEKFETSSNWDDLSGWLKREMVELLDGYLNKAKGEEAA